MNLYNFALHAPEELSILDNELFSRTWLSSDTRYALSGQVLFEILQKQTNFLILGLLNKRFQVLKLTLLGFSAHFYYSGKKLISVVSSG